MFPCFSPLASQSVPNPLMCYKFPVDIESSAQFKKPTEATVADFSKRAVRDIYSRSRCYLLVDGCIQHAAFELLHGHAFVHTKVCTLSC